MVAGSGGRPRGGGGVPGAAPARFRPGRASTERFRCRHSGRTVPTFGRHCGTLGDRPTCRV
ncbi:hypothetical protein C6W10_28145 [Plantactinospora sp. BB1]|nr:hypothetical protein C6W10_28145 [Plantactinospora sp. BB1]